ncbi:hypothetical protein SAMN05444141_10720 [Pseudovibrio denitrificans]|uniref:Uncharacterized protein n=1 Tax=Pseudovibrio denitrificans TaxID=258256 RepID=A0A1I7CY73_9HYPH|nr:hypothetical protein [Pseudovibrio denitrificans]SFU04391.1 hypothetical protein SAMN05444141_10720 [Pseudovibrio denitrificans]
MKRIAIAGAALVTLSGAAFADALTFYDGNGTKTIIQTNSLTGCVAIYDSGRNPLQICRLNTAPKAVVVPAPATTIVTPAPTTTVVTPAPTTTVVTPAPVAVAPNAWDRRQDRATARRVIRRTEARQDLFD